MKKKSIEIVTLFTKFVQMSPLKLYHKNDHLMCTNVVGYSIGVSEICTKYLQRFQLLARKWVKLITKRCFVSWSVLQNDPSYVAWIRHESSYFAAVGQPTGSAAITDGLWEVWSEISPVLIAVNTENFYNVCGCARMCTYLHVYVLACVN